LKKERGGGTCSIFKFERGGESSTAKNYPTGIIGENNYYRVNCGVKNVPLGSKGAFTEKKNRNSVDWKSGLVSNRSKGKVRTGSGGGDKSRGVVKKEKRAKKQEAKRKLKDKLAWGGKKKKKKKKHFLAGHSVYVATMVKVNT